MVVISHSDGRIYIIECAQLVLRFWESRAFATDGDFNGGVQFMSGLEYPRLRSSKNLSVSWT